MIDRLGGKTLHRLKKWGCEITEFGLSGGEFLRVNGDCGFFPFGWNVH
jgi:hypothetical protein